MTAGRTSVPSLPRAGRGARARGPVGASGLTLLVLALSIPTGLAVTVPTGSVSHPGGGHVAGGAPVNENLSLPLPNPSSPGPNGTPVALNGAVGDVLTLTVFVALNSFNDSWGVYQLHMPSLSVRFPLYNGSDPQFPITVASKNLTFPQNGTTAYQSAITLKQAAPFRLGLNATLTSNGYAPSSSLPWGTVALNVSWSYTLNTSGGAKRASAGPGVPQAVFPARSFGLAYAGPAAVLLGTQYTVCLNGPVLNRTFGLRGVNATGTVFANLTSTLLPGATGCLEIPVPADVTGGRITVQLWEYTSEPIRLRPLTATTTSGPVAHLAGVVTPTSVAALVTVDSFPVTGTASGNYSIGLPPGFHRVFYNASGFWPQASAVNLTGGATDWVNLTLLPMTQEPTHFGAPPLINLSPLQAGSLVGAVLLVAVLAVYAIRQRRRPPTVAAAPAGASGPANP